MHDKSTTGQNLVAIGGGTGLSTLLAGLKQRVGKSDEQLWLENLSAIVTVSDDGGSSGRLRDELQRRGWVVKDTPDGTQVHR